jgi:hypothetical protein
MPRESTLARAIVVVAVAIAASAVGLGVASSSDNPRPTVEPSDGAQRQLASPRTVTLPVDTTTVPPPPSSTTTSVTAAAKAIKAQPAAAPRPTTTKTTPTAPVTAAAPSAGGIAIGDSVLEDVALYAPSTLGAHGIVINAAVSRQWGAGERIVAGLRAAGPLPPVVVIALGTNGPISARDFDQMMTDLAGVRRVVFMTVTGPVSANNNVIRAGVSRYHQAALADWATLSAANPSWFASDHVHIGPAGARALGALLASEV